MGEAMKKVDHLVARAFKGAMAFVLAVGLCPVAPAMAQEGATANEEGGVAAAVVDDAGASTDGAVAGATGGVAGSEADGVQPGGVSGDGDAAADGAGVGAPAQDAVENDDADSGVSTDAAEAASAADEEADESNDADAQTDGWQAWGGCEWMVDSEGCLTIRPKDGAEVGQLPNCYHDINNWSSESPWCAIEYKESVKSVKVEKLVKASQSLEGIFEDLSCASIMDLSGLDVSSVTDMSFMFEDCWSLASLDLSGWDTSSVTDMSRMFYGCSSLASLGISGWDTSSVTDMSRMFYGCSSLASLGISGWDTSKVTDTFDMFSRCSSLASLDVSGWDVSSVRSMSSMFSRCSSLASLDLSGWDTSSVTSMFDMFSDCLKLASLNLSGWDTSKVTLMYSMFSYCVSLTSLDLSGWDTSGVTDMRDTFSGCSSLASLDLSGWDTSGVTDMRDTFSGCSSLASLDLSGWDTSGVTDMQDTFSGCSSLTSLDLSSFDDSSLKYRGGLFHRCAILEQISIGEHFALSDVMPTPSSVEGWTGKWVDEAGSVFSSGEIPTGKKGTYRAQIGLKADMFTVDCSDSFYTGYEITKTVLSSKLLEGLDYDVSYSSNIYVGIASIDITGVGRATGTLHYEFNITRATPQYDVPAPIDAAYGQTLSDAALPEGFSWQDDPSTSVGDAGEHEFLAAFTPGDTSNYEVVRDVPVKVRVIRPVDASMFSVDAVGC